jgi:glycosidase
MLWGDKDTVSDPIGSTYDAKLQTNGTVKSQLSDKNSLYNHYKKLIMIREAYPEIARGDYEKLDFSRYQTVGGFISKYNGSEVVVLHNTSDEEVSLDLTNFNLDTYTLMVYAGFNKAKQTGSNLTIGPYTSVILKIV